MCSLEKLGCDAETWLIQRYGDGARPNNRAARRRERDISEEAFCENGRFHPSIAASVGGSSKIFS